jgi:hypothetical protein
MLIFGSEMLLEPLALAASDDHDGNADDDQDGDDENGDGDRAHACLLTAFAPALALNARELLLIRSCC